MKKLSFVLSIILALTLIGCGKETTFKDIETDNVKIVEQNGNADTKLDINMLIKVGDQYLYTAAHTGERVTDLENLEELLTVQYYYLYLDGDDLYLIYGYEDGTGNILHTKVENFTYLEEELTRLSNLTENSTYSVEGSFDKYVKEDVVIMTQTNDINALNDMRTNLGISEMLTFGANETDQTTVEAIITMLNICWLRN